MSLITIDNNNNELMIHGSFYEEQAVLIYMYLQRLEQYKYENRCLKFKIGPTIPPTQPRTSFVEIKRPVRCSFVKIKTPFLPSLIEYLLKERKAMKEQLKQLEASNEKVKQNRPSTGKSTIGNFVVQLMATELKQIEGRIERVTASYPKIFVYDTTYSHLDLQTSHLLG
jgi:hypothetical protein